MTSRHTARGEMIVKDTIYYVGGGKGGVGKSMVSLTLIQYLIDKYGESKTINLIETDESNPDVGRVYRGKIPVTNVILDEGEKGWILMSELIETSTSTQEQHGHTEARTQFHRRA